jgi:hypothetical protein
MIWKSNFETPQEFLERRIAEERIINKCSERMLLNEDNILECSHLCTGCNDYQPDYNVCDLRENVRVALCEDQWDEEYDVHPQG